MNVNDQPKSYTFDEFVQYGRDAGANIVGGMPWSFKFHSDPVTHETDVRYMVGSKHFNRGEVIHWRGDGVIEITRAA